jgi:hypothetical protein
MKKFGLFLVVFVLVSFLSSCCTCMNCPGSAIYTGTGSDEICKTAYEADPSNASLSWEQYSDYMLQNGCSCID